MLQEADMDLTQMAFNERGARDDENLFVRFSVRPRLDEDASQKEGRPIYKDTDYIEILQPGNKENIIMRPVTKADAIRFARQYQHWKANNQNPDQRGTPLDAWPALSRSMVEELKYFNVFTVEQLASLSDSSAQKFAGLSSLRTRAKAFLEASGKSAEGESIVQRVQATEQENQELRAQLADTNRKLNALLEKLTEPEPTRKKA